MPKKTIKKDIRYNEEGISSYKAIKLCEVSNLFSDGFDGREIGEKGFFVKDTVTIKIQDLGEERDRNKQPALKKGDKVKITIEKL